MRKKTILCVAAAAICLFSAVQSSLAAWRVSDPSTHAISIASLSGRIVEVYDEVNDLEAGQTVPKVVNVKNTGTSDSVIRIKVIKTWGSGRTDEGNLIPDPTLSPDVIFINYNSDMWFFNENDGYYYYKGVLQPGEMTKKAFMDSFYVDESVNFVYNGRAADIEIKLECLQAAANAISVWNMSFEELGISYNSSQAEAGISRVDFTGSSFQFDPTDTDLFINFKDLLPGETRAQTITVKNSAQAKVTVLLRAEIAEQSEATAENSALIDRLLREFVTVVVTAEDGTVLYNGPVWGEPLADSRNPGSMRYDISLGSFSANEMKKLTVQLQVDPKVDNEYQALWGNIRWVWSAMGEDGGVIDTPVDPPKTGDTNLMYLYFGIMFASGLVVVLLLRSLTNDNEGKKRFNQEIK